MINIMSSPYLILKDPTDGYECRINVGDQMYVKCGGEYQKIILFNIHYKYGNTFNYYHIYIIGFIPDNPDRVIEVPIENIGLDRGDFIKDSEGLEYELKLSYIAMDSLGYPLRKGDRCRIITLMSDNSMKDKQDDHVISVYQPIDGHYVNGTVSNIELDSITFKTPNGVTIKVSKNTNRYLIYKYI